MGERLVFFGPGRAGLSIGYALWQTGGIDRLTYYGRRPDPPAHPLFTQGSAEYVFGIDRPDEATTSVILSVPDDALVEAAEALAARGPAPDGCCVYHLSGLSTEPLAALHARGYSVGSLHPLATFGHPVTGADRLGDCTFSVSGEPEAVTRGRALIHLLGARAIQVPVRARPAYHAAAVFASNYVATVVLAAARLLTQAGVPESEAVDALLPMAQGTLEDLQSLRGHNALVGPVIRRDFETLALHLRALDPADSDLYRVLGKELVRVCVERGFDEDQATEILQVLSNN